ncbi:MAG: FAD-binding oxidoreductase [Syntrophorhabdales bacterium]
MNAKRKELIEVVGEGNVLDNQEDLQAYSQDESFARPLKPWYVAKPHNAGEVETLVQWANRTNTPLVPISSGPPHFRGDTVPSVPGAVMVDLSGMDKILRIDTRNRMAVIEPGVTYAQLLPELAKEGLQIPIPMAPRSNKSVIGSLLEREPNTMPAYQWQTLEPLRCLEVVWGDGQKMTTGETGQFGSLEKDWEKGFAQVNPRGPAQADFYKFTSAAQGGMGLVTWASVRCQVMPQVHNLYFVPASEVEDLFDLAYELLKFRFGDELLLLNGWNLATILGSEAGNIKELAGGFPRWVLIVGIAGRDRLPGEKVAYLEKDIAEMAQERGLCLVPFVQGATGREVLEVILNPSTEPYWKMRYKGSSQDIFFLTTLDKTPEFVKAMNKVADSLGYPSSEIGVYIQPLHQGVNCHCEFSLSFDRSNTSEASRMKDLYAKASDELLKQGAFYSRPYGLWAQMAFNRDAQTTDVLKRIKGIFDPNNIMNPGKLCF